jgi:uncharacterized phage protein (TIGR02218 family)
MLTLSAAYLAHLEGDVLELATCWRVERRDGVVLGFTDHPTDLSIGGVLYEAAVGYAATDLESASNLAVDNLDIQGIANSPSITEADLIAGVWDWARVEIFEVIYSDLSAGTRPLKGGRIGEIRMGRAQFVAELRSLTQQLAQNILEVSSPTCRARLGDARCKVPLGPLTVTGAVSSVTSPRVWTDTARTEADGLYAFGVVTWTSGANAGLSKDVKSSTSAGVVELVEPMPYAITVGDGYSMHEGCDGRLETCRDRFANVPNMRAEPYKPGQDFLIRGPR